ncbi:MAG: FG-GAP-like repeat-containing protein [Acidobacteriota bacterium]
MNIYQQTALLALAGILTGWQQTPTTQTQPAQAQPRPERKPLALYRVQSGDIDGDGKSELISWDSESKVIRISSYVGGTWKELTSTKLQDFPTFMIAADLDGDRKAELIIGEGLRGYNPKAGPQTDVQLRIYRPLSKDGWTPTEIFRQVTERPEFTSLESIDLDGDKKPELLFAFFAEKYQVDLRVARRTGTAWKIEELPRVRMGMNITAGDVLRNGKKMTVVGRPYGEGQTAIGDAFILDGTTRLDLPVFRGVSSIAVGDVEGDRQLEVIVGDGWHSDYGKVARGRLAVMTRVDGKWNYELIEDVPDQVRIRRILITDLDGDGKGEILVHGERKSSLGGDVRLYQHTAKGWRGATIVKDVQTFGFGSFSARSKKEILAGGKENQLIELDLQRAPWDAALAEEVETYQIDAATLIGKPTPRVQAEEWIGSEPLTMDKLKGKVVLLDFWATWCVPCIAQFPTMKQWQEKYGPRGLVIIGVTNHSSQTSQDVRAFLAKDKLPWPVAIDSRSRTQMDFGVSPIPHTFVIDRAGNVTMSHVGGKNIEEIERKIESLLGDR